MFVCLHANIVFMPNKTQLLRMQVKFCYTDKEWETISQKINNKKLSEFFLMRLSSHFSKTDAPTSDVKVVKSFMIADQDLKKAIKKKASELKMKPAKLLSKIIFDPVLYQTNPK